MKQLLITAFLLINFLSASARVQLPSVLSDGMVLQQQSLVNLWGKSNPGKTVIISPSWSGNTYKAVADKTGDWSVQIPTIAAGGPYSIVFNDGDQLTLTDVLLGEVWLCSGQSNMEMPVKGFNGQPVNGSLETIMNSEGLSSVRMFTGKKSKALTPQFTIDGSWAGASAATTGDFSAVGYYFAHQLYKMLNVPIGMIHVSWGGSSIESWMSPETLKMFPEVDLATVDIDSKHPQQVPTLLYNGMLKPVGNYSINGAIWYQGESNRNAPELYTRLFPAMVKEWRQMFSQSEFPFYFVQIAPYNYEDADEVGSALMREAQLKCMELTPNSGMAVTLDIGEARCIHPAEKQKVGQRLALWALAKNYGFESLPYSGPIYHDKEIKEDKIILTFSHADNGLIPRFYEVEGFEIAGADGLFVKARASVAGADRIEVWADGIQAPEHVRYGFKNFTVGTLFNGYGLPAGSFRTEP